MRSDFVKMSELPFELVVEILARVPVKDLIRFRCVCKTWRSLFQDERFIEQHMTHAPRKIMLFRASSTPLFPLTYESCNPNQAILQLQEVDLNIEDKRWLSNSRVIGCCHGLFCLRLRDNTFGIWNPSLRDLRRIQTRHIENWAGVGFGYDHSTQDYKLVLLIEDNEMRFSKAKVLSIKSGVSRMIDFPCLENFVISHMREPGALVGENIYWQIFDKGLYVIEKILSFDLVSETFNYYPAPPVDRFLKEFKGSLCAIGTERGDLENNGVVIWSAQHEKENHGVVKSWTKILRLSWAIIDSLIGRRVDNFSRLVSAITHEDLLLFRVVGFGGEEKLLAYNLEENSLRLVEISLPINRCGLLLQTYIETLVPIPGAL